MATLHKGWLIGSCRSAYYLFTSQRCSTNFRSQLKLKGPPKIYENGIPFISVLCAKLTLTQTRRLLVGYFKTVS